MSRRASAARDRCLELERVIADRARSGSLGIDDALKLFDELLPHARPASVRAFNHLLNVVARARCSSTSELAVSLFNRMARACSNKVYVYKERSSIGSPIMTFIYGVNTSNLPGYLILI
ncbi:uncharacterized protein LOC8069268 [Sorghum bicolor]|uniref:uncharacterized protein LOC8069268 n=1 Tax=Sorghum bicolor TaxID=4558 RepID=UPI000B4254F4|nr:uncharacterized protein LOC8069268 [Sorghum bicolor]|eukprot:XP_021317425.1 uncharacterized protein LOC8069268 [Sorghum bicolor]